MNKLVLNTMSKYRLLQNGDRVIVALSGGADSVALLDVLISLKEKLNLTVYAAHVNHNLRGAEADRDESFCKFLCKNYNTELFVKSVNVRALAKEQRISEELCGRNVRYGFFDELSARLGAKVATAHTASDNAETLIFNIMRGSSLRGVCAIPPKRGNIIRPLIEVTRDRIEDYCRKKGLEYMTDSTNSSDDYTRNKIRHNVIPVLKEINPGFEAAAMRLSENASDILSYINSQTASSLDNCRVQYGYDCKRLAELDSAILNNAVVTICREEAHFSPEQRHIDLIKNIINNGGAINLPNGFSVIAKQNILRIAENVSSEDFAQEFSPVELKSEMSFEFSDKQYSVKEILLASKDESELNAASDGIDDYNNLLNPDILADGPVFRTRRQGDRFTYPQRRITKPLRKTMNEMKIPSEARDKILVLALDSTILWCESIGASLQAQYNNSDKALKIDVKQANRLSSDLNAKNEVV